MPCVTLEGYGSGARWESMIVFLSQMRKMFYLERDKLDLAKMNLLLLEKVEVLTLHLIEKEQRRSC
ncbi:hypothetical protein ACFOET_11785 [Parapedobacter deserti]|uniref:Four helix bundle protein n=1 Tax=Parapedobacter deserti TaxID=1912957 RepID=A0ABV7JJY4_9SPHI